MSTTMKVQKNPSMSGKEESKEQVYSESKTNNYEELEEICKAKDEEIEQNLQDIKQKEKRIQELVKENKDHKIEIEDLNNLVSIYKIDSIKVSKYAAQQYLTQSPPTQSHLSHFMNQEKESNQSIVNGTLERTGREMIKKAKEKCKIIRYL